MDKIRNPLSHTLALCLAASFLKLFPSLSLALSCFIRLLKTMQIFVQTIHYYTHTSTETVNNKYIIMGIYTYLSGCILFGDALEACTKDLHFCIFTLNFDNAFVTLYHLL